MTHARRATCAVLLALALLSSAGRTRAQGAEGSGVTVTEGVVVALENGEIVVDLAGKRGASSGDIVELWRPLRLKHPVTGKMVTDRFRIGSLQLTQVRSNLALARPDGKLAREPQAGDVVILRKTKLAEAAPSKAEAPPSKKAEKPSAPSTEVVPRPAESQPEAPAAAMAPEAQEVSEMFDSLKGADITRRIIVYESYVRKDPKGRFAVVLWEEAAQLRRLLALEATGRGGGKPQLKSFKGPKEALAGIALQLGVETEGPAVGAVLHARRSGEVAFRSHPMSPAGNGYFTASIPPERMRSGALQYFIEATTADGAASALVGSPEAPESMRVEEIPKATPPLRNEAVVSLWTDYADYNRWKGNDRTWQTEGLVGMRFADEGLRALRSGFGVYRGVGGSLEELDEQKKSARRVGLTYGYLETEYAFTSFTAMIMRGLVGLGDEGVTGGAQLLLRLGNDKKTNLQIGGEVLGAIGLRSIAQLELNVFENVPMLFRTEVTNQPAGSQVPVNQVRPDDPDALPEDTSTEVGEVGARAIFQLGYVVTPGLTLAARGSYQGRTIKHAGPGLGGAVTYTW